MRNGIHHVHDLTRAFARGILHKLEVGWESKPDLRDQGLYELGEGPGQQGKMAKLLRSSCQATPIPCKEKQTKGHPSCRHASRSNEEKGPGPSRKDSSFS